MPDRALGCNLRVTESWTLTTIPTRVASIMPVKVRRTSSRQASSTNLASKMALATITAHNQPPQVDKDGEKHLKKRTNSSQGLAQHQPRPFSRTGSQSKLYNKPSTKHVEEQVESPPDSQPVDDDDWVSSSSAVASPAPEPDDEEEDATIYVNPNLISRHTHHESPPATPKRTNHPLPHHHTRRHQVASHATDQSPVPSTRYPNNGVLERHQTGLPSESSRIRFAGEPQDPAFQVHQQDSRIHHNGVLHHVSPPPSATAAAANSSDPIQLSSSVIRVSSDPVMPDKPVNGTHHSTQRADRSQNTDERGNRRVSAKLQQEQVDEYSARQIAATQSIRPAVSGNGDATYHVAQEDIGRTSQRGFGAPPTHVHHPFNDAPPQVAPSAYNSPPVPHRRPSMLRRDTTPTAMSRSPVAIDTLPRSLTPPASMTHDEMVASNNKRHSIHSTGGHRRPMSLLQPSQTKRHSLTSRPGTHYDYRHAHNPNNPLSLLVRLNPMQGSPLTAPPTVSPGVAQGEIDHEANYISMSPTFSHSGGRSLRKRASAASLNSIATAPVVSTSTTMAMGSSASPTSALKTTSSAILSSLAHQPAMQTSMASRSDSKPDLRRGDSLRVDDGPNFVSQFCSSLETEANRIGNRKAKTLGRVMAGREWTSHRTAMDHRGLLFESFNRLSTARPGGTRVRR